MQDENEGSKCAQRSTHSCCHFHPWHHFGVLFWLFSCELRVRWASRSRQTKVIVRRHLMYNGPLIHGLPSGKVAWQSLIFAAARNHRTFFCLYQQGLACSHVAISKNMHKMNGEDATCQIRAIRYLDLASHARRLISQERYILHCDAGLRSWLCRLCGRGRGAQLVH